MELYQTNKVLNAEFTIIFISSIKFGLSMKIGTTNPTAE